MSDLKVMMVPHAKTVQGHSESGIKTLILKYFKYLPQFDIELVEPNANSFDVLAIHAGMSNQYPHGVPTVSHIHGLYWTADYPAQTWQHKANQSVINSLRLATLITCPSQWVAQTVRRDMHIDPIVVRHGIDCDEWQHDKQHREYVLWNKNRNMDVCSPRPVHELAERRPHVRFLSTFADGTTTPNIKVTGLVPHETMRGYIQHAMVYLATTKETFGIGTIEAMASGIPVLGFNHGGTAQIVRHGVTGYLAKPGDFDDLARGLDYCIKYRDTLGQNARISAKEYDWPSVAEFLSDFVYRRAVSEFSASEGVSVVIPCYNKADTLERAVSSVLNQTLPVKSVIIVDNNSIDESPTIARKLANLSTVRFIRCQQQGVAHARNAGIAVTNSKYVCCLDADDEIAPQFLEKCVAALEGDKSLGLAYTRLEAIDANNQRTISHWPGIYNFDEFLKGRNQVPTCCVFRRDIWERLGGYRQRYAPDGAGAEDAEFWYRIGAYGYKGVLASEEPLFKYHLGGSVSGNPSYSEVNWRAWHPWTTNGRHPFASAATPTGGRAHDVRQYDQPSISVIIPCAEHHTKYLWDILDSLDAQDFHKWEAIVVYDFKGKNPQIEKAFPHVKFLNTAGEQGPGTARNLGAKFAVAPLLLFVDADDWLMPGALEVFANAYRADPDTIIYSDYLAHSYIEHQVEINKLQIRGRLKSYNPKTKEAIIYHRSSEYDCRKAQAQPQPGNMYIWNLISSLVPKKFHDAIGGFDESMRSWEDWDYWLRMSHRGWCFTQIEMPLIEYRFYTGTRRAEANPDESGESGRLLGQKLIEYLHSKYEGVDKMACGGCKKNRQLPPAGPAVAMANTLNQGVVNNMNSSDLVWVELTDGNIGQHPVSFAGTQYGYRVHGERFKMQASHAQLDRRVRIVQPDMVQPEIPHEPLPEAAPPPSYAEWHEEDENESPETRVENDTSGIMEIEIPEFDLTAIWGINEERSEQLMRMGACTPQGIAALGVEQLKKILGVSDLVARRIISSAQQRIE